MWQLSVSRSKEETYLKASSFKTKSYLIGNGFLLILLSSLKSEMKQTVPFFLGIINVGIYDSFETPIFTYLLASVLRVSLSIFGIGNGFVWYGWATSKSSNLYPYNFLNRCKTCFHVSLIAYELKVVHLNLNILIYLSFLLSLLSEFGILYFLLLVALIMFLLSWIIKLVLILQLVDFMGILVSSQPTKLYWKSKFVQSSHIKSWPNITS